MRIEVPNDRDSMGVAMFACYKATQHLIRALLEAGASTADVDAVRDEVISDLKSAIIEGVSYEDESAAIGFAIDITNAIFGNAT